VIKNLAPILSLNGTNFQI